MATYTTLLKLLLPTVSGDADVWGGYLNLVIQALDKLLNGVATTGSANAYVLTTGQSLTTYQTGETYKLIPNFSNTGAATLNRDTAGAKNLYKLVSGTPTALASGDVPSGVPIIVMYDGTQFVILSASTNQPLDATLTALAGLTTGTNNYIRSTGTDAFTMDSYATVKTNLGLDSSSNPQFATIELGNASDTTLSRVSAGVVAVEGVNVLTTATGMKQGLVTIPVMAGAMLAATTNGPTASQLESTTNKNNVKVLGFNTTTQQFACFAIPMPKSWDNGTITFQVHWTFQSSTGGVAWALEAQACSDGDTIDGSWGTAVQVTDTALTANQEHITATSSALTVGGSPATADMIYFRIKRVPADAADTLGADAQLIGIRLFFTQNASDDT